MSKKSRYKNPRNMLNRNRKTNEIELRCGNLYLKLILWGAYASIAILFILFILLCMFAISNILMGYLGGLSIFISNLGNIAIFSTLIFTLYQSYKTNRSKGEYFAYEQAKECINKTIEYIDGFSLDNKIPNSIDSFSGRFIAYQSDFDIYYNSIDDGVINKCLRMRWQDMYFNYFLPFFNGIELSDLVPNYESVEQEVSNFSSEFENVPNRIMQVYIAYEKYKYILSKLVKNNSLLISKITLNTYKVLEEYYINNDNVREMLQGTMNIIDPRVQSPLLSALIDTQKSQTNH